MNTRPWISATAGSVVASLAIASAPALADREYAVGRTPASNGMFDYARVLSSEPIVRIVTVETPVRECWTETREYVVEKAPRTAGSTLLGAVIGGVVGHQFGSGRGNDAATVAGTLIGAAVGSDVSRRRAEATGLYGKTVQYEPVQRCETNYRKRDEERIDGYRVTYRYNGQKYATRMPYDPGDRLRVRVDVRPSPG